MVANLRHFAIECDDIERARAFYEAVMGWTIRPWGPPGFYQIFTGSPAHPGVQGALQARREPLSGTGNGGLEATFGVDDVQATLDAAEAHGGRVLMAEFRIEGVGTLAFIEDTEGNRIGVMRYDPHRDWPPEVLPETR